MTTYKITYQPKGIKLTRPISTVVDADDRTSAEAFFNKYYPNAEMLSIHPKT